jgi:hypothetical protein
MQLQAHKLVVAILPEHRDIQNGQLVLILRVLAVRNASSTLIRQEQSDSIEP